MKIRMTQDYCNRSPDATVKLPMVGDVLEVIEHYVEDGLYLCAWDSYEPEIDVYYYECEVVK